MSTSTSGGGPYCRECGTGLPPDANYCGECGASVGGTEVVERDDEWGDPADVERMASKDSTSGRETMFYVGAVLGVAAVVFIPFVFVFVAIPEAIYNLRGGTMQDYFPRDARDNPAVTGSMLIFRWFGNFLIFLIVVGFILGLLYGILVVI